MINKLQIKAIFLFGYLLLAAVLLYPALGSFFSQDDFHHLKTIMDNNLSDIPSFFTTWQEGQTFYRPISREIFNLLMYKIFGLNPLPFHIVNFLQVLLLAFLTFKLAFKITNQKITALFAAVFFILSPIHSVELYYLASVQTLFAAIFLISSLLLYPKNLLLSLLLFIFALLSHPMSLVLLPLILLQKIHRSFSLYLLLGLCYILYSSLLNLPDQKVYQPVYSLKSMANTFGWYTLWSFGLPEMLTDFIGPKFNINPNLIRWYKDYLLFTVPTLGFFTSVLLFLLYKFRKTILKERLLILFGLGFTFSLSTFLAFPQHKFVSYLSFAIVWFSMGLGYLAYLLYERNNLGKAAAVLLMVLFAAVSWQTSRLNEKTHWAAKRAAAAKFILDDIKNTYHKVDKGAVFVFENDPNYPNIGESWGTSSKQAFYILSGSDSLKLLYHDSSVMAYYEDINKLPDDIEKSKVIYYRAKFPY